MLRLGEPLDAFSPIWWARGAHAQTMLGHLLAHPRLPTHSERCEILLDDGDRVSMSTDHPASSPRASVLLMHGLGGNAAARYMLLASRRLVSEGHMVFRLDHRGAGEGAGLARKSYQLGGSGDVRQTVDHLVAAHPHLPLIAVGFSMSGSILLKYLGEQKSDIPPLLRGGIAVNPPIDIPLAIEALEQRRNWIYHRRFTGLLRDLARTNFAAMADMQSLAKVAPSGIRAFDTAVTAPLWGYASAEAYYQQASPLPLLRDIALRTLVITSDDDPFVPVASFHEASWSSAVVRHITRGGGHMGYLAPTRNPFCYRRWLDDVLVTAVRRLVEAKEA